MATINYCIVTSYVLMCFFELKTIFQDQNLNTAAGDRPLATFAKLGAI